MKYKKMTNPTDGINQTNKQLSTVEDQLCCLDDSVKAVETAIENLNVDVQVGAVSIGDGPNLDAFSRLRVSNPLILFNSQFTYNLNPILMEQITSGTGSSIVYSSTNREAVLSFSTTGAGGKAYMQSYEYLPYQPGRSQLIFVTFNMVESKPNVVKFAGYSDGVNGVEFQLNGATKQFVIYSGTSSGNNTAIQSNWNLDKLDGTGPSGINLDITKDQILVIDIQALYVGRVRVGFDLNGTIIYAHEFLHSNIVGYPYIQSANLPVRCGMTCSATSTTTMQFICSAVMSEGGVEDANAFGYNFETNNSVTASTGGVQLMSLRPKSTFNGITNRIRVSYIDVEIFNIGTSNQHVRWDLCVGQAITGGTWADVNTTYSSVEKNTGATLSGSPAIIMDSGWVSVGGNDKKLINTSVTSRYPITLDAAGNHRDMGTLTLKITALNGTPTVYGGIKFREIR